MPVLCVLMEILSHASAVRFDGDPFTCQCEKENKRLKGLKFRNFTGRFEMTSWQ